VLVPAWILGAVAAYHWLPSYSQAEGGASQLVSVSTPALRAEAREAKTFGFPFTSQSVLVQHDRRGLSPAAQVRVVARAARIDAQALHGNGALAAALPLLDTGGVFPTSKDPGSTALTYLFFKPSTSPSTVQQVDRRLAHQDLGRPGDHYVGATGLYAAEQDQGNRIGGSLRLVEAAAIGVVFLVIALAFRSLVAPLVVLVAVGISYVLGEHVLAYAALHLGFVLPGELEPLIVILVVGVVTDYAVFFLSAQRTLLRDGLDPRDAARMGARTVMPLVTVAGITVAAGTATLLVARLPLYHQLGPGMAIAVAISLVVSLTFVPAAVALMGRALFWPVRPGEPGGDPRPRRRRLIRLAMRRPVAALVLLAAVGGLGAGVAQIGNLRLGLNLVSDLPASSGAARASTAAAAGFAPGVVDPSVVMVRGSGVGRHPGELAALQHELARQPGVAAVIGPADTGSLLHFGLFVASDRAAARYVVILSHPPLGADAVGSLDHIERNMPTLLRVAGLHRVRTAYSGGTAIAGDLSSETRTATYRVGVAILAVDFLMLVLLLRCLLTPLVLLAASVMSVMAAIGITSAVFPDLAARGFTFYVPIAVGVLLLSFGSDYNIFLVGRIWEEARQDDLHGAIITAVPGASTTITRAGVALAFTFALLALVPLRSFESFGFAMAVGILLDTFVVRSMIVPASLRLLGRWAGLPNPGLMRRLARTGG
jgi:RND superfamily putative drug exporter